ncbi:acetylxylan esterase [Streptomyces sp. MP131-18]|uniref:acetylxylan esterase n=1 Tax=Streptomyces sp. MP131-18 TaxID=1857892 RepID=UPI00097C66FD|nr:acetylxylan esterase [Streptomyces sp. MP131-18]
MVNETDAVRRAAALRHGFAFDPRHGYDLPALRAVGAPATPDGFDAFWRARHAAARAVEAAPVVGPRERRAAGFDVHPVRYTSVGGRRIGGWLTLPSDGRVTRGCVAAHGYGGLAAPEPALPPPGAATIWPCLRGLGARSRFPDVPEAPDAHVLHGIEGRETYVHGACAADVWCAASALLTLVPAAAGRLDFVGVSFGGGIGALALPWDERFHGAALTVPSFGNHPLRLTLPCTGSGEAVRARHARDPAVAGVLRYFDAAVAASRIAVPVLVAAALFDPAVPPPGQFAVHNALGGPAKLFVLTAGHFDYPALDAETAALRAAQHRFLGGGDARPQPAAGRRA